MKTVQYLSDPTLAGLYWPGVLTGLMVGLVCAVLSVLVVLKRMSFIGQGISHAAFGGVGVAALAGAAGGLAAGPAQSSIILVFCLGAAIMIAWLSDQRSAGADTAIGIVLVASMAAGAILMHIAWRIEAVRMPSWESVLFGSILAVDKPSAWSAAATSAASLLTLWWFRRPMLFWAFDEPNAPAFGIPARAMKMLFILLLTVAIVTGMRLVGVVLITAMLVLPGATALALTDRWWPAVGAAIACGLVGVAGGIFLSFEADWPSGPSIVAVLALQYAAATIAGLAPRLARVGRAY